MCVRARVGVGVYVYVCVCVCVCLCVIECVCHAACACVRMCVHGYMRACVHTCVLECMRACDNMIHVAIGPGIKKGMWAHKRLSGLLTRSSRISLCTRRVKRRLLRGKPWQRSAPGGKCLQAHCNKLQHTATHNITQ